MRSQFSWTVSSLVLISLAATSLSAQGFDAKKTFQQKCSMCHGADGKQPTMIGKNLGSPDLSSDKVQKMTDKDLHAIIENGKGKMPSYGKALGDGNIDPMVKYVRSLSKK
jgi:mono/diheme cytochrome c family protein